MKDLQVLNIVITVIIMSIFKMGAPVVWEVYVLKQYVNREYKQLSW